MVLPPGRLSPYKSRLPSQGLQQGPLRSLTTRLGTLQLSVSHEVTVLLTFSPFRFLRMLCQASPVHLTQLLCVSLPSA